MTPDDFKAARLTCGPNGALTQTEWGRLLGIGKRQVIHIEQGTRECSQTIALLVGAIQQGYRPKPVKPR